ncbi:condensation domain-containing protein [Staphylococcus xylosus]|uniref:condensation domain-containing protein n=2 Tax=Staphylococcus xylosus TaxID=1288 RepID=UPI002DBAC5D2|nr:condensation domain-containing protein [Staphylococcus xylosus]MEB7814836.1 condensation domain-containing protein [Staphylococcus xylosus]MEB7837654.1 condensation domain-containing protein [Staphylococcus xylosus]MEB7866002.1 condensation domain-containing protein [Staphylococcus xylosus]
MKKYKMSTVQDEFIRIEERHENTSINNIAGIIHIKKQLNYQQINDAFNKVIEQHDTLRIRFTKEDSEYRQYVADYEEQHFEFLNFHDDQVNYDKWLKNNTNRNLFISDENLYHVKVVKCPDGHMGIFIILHHLIIDIWGITIIIDNFVKKLIGKKNEMISNSTYLEIITNEQDYKSSKRFIKDQAFWLKKTKYFENNSLFENNRLNSIVGERLRIDLSDKLSAKINHFCTKNAISVSNLFTAIMHIIKHKKTRAKTTSIGMVIHNRNGQNEKQSTGLFAKYLPMIVEINNDLSITDFLYIVKLESLNLLKYRHYPFRYIVKNCKNRKGLKDCFISFQNAKYDAEFIKDGFTDEWLSNGTNVAPLGINICNRSNKNNLEFDYAYQTDVLDKAGIYRLHETILNVFNKISENPEQKISEMNISLEEVLIH